MTFKDLKLKYKDIDLIKNDEERLLIGDFFIESSGRITLSRHGHSFEDEGLSIWAIITKTATIKQMENFIEMIRG